MPHDLIRETPFGQIVHALSRGAFLQYPEQEPGFKYSRPVARSVTEEADSDAISVVEGSDAANGTQDKIESSLSVVTWYNDIDPANPRNWSRGKKLFVALTISLYEVVVYGAASVTPSAVEDLQRSFSINTQLANLPTSLYVLGYGLGALFLSPLSEVPTYGRNPFYWIPTFLFVALQVGSCLTPSFAGLNIIRFLTGILASPVIATGGATLSDMYESTELPVYLCFWGIPAFLSPALGPLVSSFAIAAQGWRWAMWEVLWASALVAIIIFLLLPETSGENILHRRAHRLRALTGDDSLKTAHHHKHLNVSDWQHVKYSICRPFLITLYDPSIAYANVYTALVYSFYWAFFVSFPLVYQDIYGFSLTGEGLAFMSCAVGCLVASTVYIVYQLAYMIPRTKRLGGVVNEERLQLALVGAFAAPVGLFIFAWTARLNVHWIATSVGAALFAGANFFTLQCIFHYIVISYEQYSASLLAANDLWRSVVSVIFLHGGIRMFNDLGVDRGTTVLAGLSLIGIPGTIILYVYGARLRARSRFAA